jgi:hypothetical protein
MPAINETKLGYYQSEILFLLIGENPLPNYVAAKLLTKPFSDGREHISPILVLICSEKTESYETNLEGILGKQDFRHFSIKVDPSDYYDISEKISSQLRNVNSKVSVGLNYTGGTKAMAVHAYRAIKELRPQAKFSYLDPRKKFMRFDGNSPGADQQWIDISDVKSQAFDMTKISLDQLLSLHGWKRFSEPSETVRFSEEQLKIESLEDFDDKMFEDFVLKTVISLKEDCKLDSMFANLEILAPKISTIEKYCEIDVVAIRGYQLFAISCTLASSDTYEIRALKCSKCGEEINRSQIKKLKDDSKHILTHKLFEVVHRARQLGGAEAQIGLVCLSDEDARYNLNEKLKDDHIAVWGKADLKNLRTKLKSWFNT